MFNRTLRSLVVVLGASGAGLVACSHAERVGVGKTPTEPAYAAPESDAGAAPSADVPSGITPAMIHRVGETRVAALSDDVTTMAGDAGVGGPGSGIGSGSGSNPGRVPGTGSGSNPNPPVPGAPTTPGQPTQPQPGQPTPSQPTPPAPAPHR